MNPSDSIKVTLLVATAATASSSNDGTSGVTSSFSETTRGTGTSSSVSDQRVGTIGSSLIDTPPEVERERHQRVHPAAMALRLRVTQVVCGILTCVLGAVAFIEERGQLRLGSGLVAGLATFVAAVASIYATFDTAGAIYYDRIRWITQYGTTPSSDMDRTSCVLSTFWAMAVVTNLAMLAFAFMAFREPSSSRNLIIIGSLEFGLGLTVLVILGVNLCLALHYKEQLMRKN